MNQQYFPFSPKDIDLDNFEKESTQMIQALHSKKFEVIVVGLHENYGKLIRESNSSLEREVIVSGYATFLGVMNDLNKYIIQNARDGKADEGIEPNLRTLPKKGGGRELVKGTLATLRDRVKFLGSPFSGSDSILLMEHSFKIALNLSKEFNKPVKYISPTLMSYFINESKLDSEIVDDIQRLSSSWENVIVSLLTEVGVTAPKNYLAKYKKAFVSSLETYAKTIISNREYIRNKGISKMLVQSAGNPFCRTMCSACRLEGIEIVGLSHSNELTFFAFKVEHMYYSIITIMDTVVVSTEKIGRAAKVSIHKYLKGIKDDVKIKVLPHIDYKQMNNNFTQEKVEKINSIVVVDRSVNPARFSTYTTTWSQTMVLNVEIAKKLKIEGVKSILNIHPESDLQLKEFYLQFYDEVVVGGFERNLHLGDAYYFPHHLSTSTLVPALMTKKPIFILDTIKEFIFESFSNEMFDRMEIGKAYFDDNDKIVVDYNHLINKIKNYKHRDKVDLIQEYLIP